ncbi:uncharacterized protein LOC133203391 [Saccostrea echinata]|uniref:uncharacterized protein LOC133203391 n=1 Tax=Saccostrea echinata TaxID=191078 RepID=UPI002A81C42B|nr:uncharacterized protein LOC133203391 [Saccostrea echinata]
MLIYFSMVLISALKGYICLPTQACIWSNRTLNVVDSCPTTKEETIKAARIKRCDGIARSQNCTKPSQFKYHCIYSFRQKMFVEVCSVETDVHGVCIVYDTRFSKIQPVYNIKCRDISAACPESYLSTEGHLYATCPGLMNLTMYDMTGKNNNPENPENNEQ